MEGANVLADADDNRRLDSFIKDYKEIKSKYELAERKIEELLAEVQRLKGMHLNIQKPIRSYRRIIGRWKASRNTSTRSLPKKITSTTSILILSHMPYRKNHPYPSARPTVLTSTYSRPSAKSSTASWRNLPLNYRVVSNY